MISSLLRQHLKKDNCLLIGVGNILCGDDGFGPQVIQRLKGKTSLHLLDAGTAPENMLGPILNLAPGVVVIVDAVSLNAPIGSLHWLAPDELDGGSISTHAPSLDLLVSYIQQYNPGSQMYILGAVPSSTRLGDNISDELKQAAEKLVSIIAELFPAEEDITPNSDNNHNKKCTNLP